MEQGPEQDPPELDPPADDEEEPVTVRPPGRRFLAVATPGPLMP